MECRALMSSMGGTWKHRWALRGSRGTKIQGSTGPQTIPFCPLGSQMEPGKARQEKNRNCARSCSSAAAPSPPISKLGDKGLQLAPVHNQVFSCVNCGLSLALDLASVSSFVVPWISFIPFCVDVWVYSFDKHNNASYCLVSTLCQALPNALYPVIQDAYLLHQRSTICVRFTFYTT